MLKRLAPPDASGDPKLVTATAQLLAASNPTNQSLGEKFSAILGNGSAKGRLQRAAERFAARKSGAVDSTAAPEDSIRKAHTQNGSSSSTSHLSSRDASSTRKLSGASDEPEDGEVDTHRAVKKRTASVDVDKASGVAKRVKHEQPDGSASSTAAAADGSAKTSATPAATPLSDDELRDKWKPSKKLKQIRLDLKKMKMMPEWSKNQKDQTVLEKVYKYVVTIGAAIDEQVRDVPAGDMDELGWCLWSYAAEFTPFDAVVFERIYDDICADAVALQDNKSKSS